MQTQSLTSSSRISLKPLSRPSSPTGFPHRLQPNRFVVQSVFRFDAVNANSSAAVNTNSAPPSVHFGGHVGATRADWQSSCAILASKVVLQQQDIQKSGEDAGSITTVNGHKTMDLVPLESSLPKPLTITDLSPAPMHGSQLRVAYQGVPGAYSEAAAGKAYPNCEAIPCDQFEVALQETE